MARVVSSSSSSSCFCSSASTRVQKKPASVHWSNYWSGVIVLTNKQTHGAENIQCSSLRYVVGQTDSPGYISIADCMGPASVNLAAKTAVLCEITRNNGQGHSRSPNLVPIESSYANLSSSLAPFPGYGSVLVKLFASKTECFCSTPPYGECEIWSRKLEFLSPCLFVCLSTR